MYLPGDDIRSNRPAATASAVSNRRISRPKPRSEARASSPLTPRSTNLATTSDALTAEMIPPLKRRAATSAPFSSNTIASSADPILKSICSTPNCLFFGRNHIKVWGTLAVCVAAGADPYLIVAAPQVGREGAGPYGCFDLWLRVNGADVANSNVQLCEDEGSRAKDVIISQGIVPMEAGDTLEVLMSANNPEAAMCIEAIQPSGEPLVPSIIFSMIK